MKTTTKNVALELRDEDNNLIAIVKKSVSLLKAFSYIKKHGSVIWKNGTPYNLCINWN